MAEQVVSSESDANEDLKVLQEEPEEVKNMWEERFAALEVDNNVRDKRIKAVECGNKKREEHLASLKNDNKMMKKRLEKLEDEIKMKKQRIEVLESEIYDLKYQLRAAANEHDLNIGTVYTALETSEKSQREGVQALGLILARQSTKLLESHNDVVALDSQVETLVGQIGQIEDELLQMRLAADEVAMASPTSNASPTSFE